MPGTTLCVELIIREFPKKRGPQCRPQIVRILSCGHPQEGPPIYRNRHLAVEGSVTDAKSALICPNYSQKEALFFWKPPIGACLLVIRAVLEGDLPGGVAAAGLGAKAQQEGDHLAVFPWPKAPSSSWRVCICVYIYNICIYAWTLEQEDHMSYDQNSFMRVLQKDATRSLLYK